MLKSRHFRELNEVVQAEPYSMEHVKAALRPQPDLSHASQGGYFILPDGSCWASEDWSHGYAFRDNSDNNPSSNITRAEEKRFWATCQQLGLVLAHTNRAYECQAAITTAQADRIVTEYMMTNPPGQEPNMLYVDIQDGGMPRDNKMFTDRVKATTLRTWVNNHF